MAEPSCFERMIVNVFNDDFLVYGGCGDARRGDGIFCVQAEQFFYDEGCSRSCYNKKGNNNESNVKGGYQ